VLLSPRLFKAFEFCLPTKSTAVPTGPDWFHEIRFDGCRLGLERDGTRPGHDRTARYLWIAACKVRLPRFMLDSEAVVLGAD
jgi:bifunctional non-homologous end joining protein LigD